MRGYYRLFFDGVTRNEPTRCLLGELNRRESEKYWYGGRRTCRPRFVVHVSAPWASTLVRKTLPVKSLEENYVSVEIPGYYSYHRSFSFIGGREPESTYQHYTNSLYGAVHYVLLSAR